ncbi:MAG: hypothetical protein ACXVFE_03930 [Gaiellaceae bacterium]
MPSVLGLALAGPRLALRALDDLHRLADAAERLPEIERTVISVQEDVVEAADRLDARLAEMMVLAERLEARAARGRRRARLAGADRPLGRRAHRGGAHAGRHGSAAARRLGAPRAPGRPPPGRRALSGPQRVNDRMCARKTP